MMVASGSGDGLVIRACGIRKTYPYPSGAGGLTVLDGVDLDVGPGRSVAIMGPSGSGKSTLLHILGTLDTPTSGSLELAGVNPCDLSGKDMAEFRNRWIGFVFQDHFLLPQCSAIENVLIPTLAGRCDRSALARRGRDLLGRLGLGDRAGHFPGQLSGGERQRVAIARALVMSPRMLLCDEPTGSVDEAAEKDIADSFVALERDEGVALVVVTHNAALASRFDRTLQLTHGRLAPVEGCS